MRHKKPKIKTTRVYLVSFSWHWDCMTCGRPNPYGSKFFEEIYIEDGKASMIVKCDRCGKKKKLIIDFNNLLNFSDRPKDKKRLKRLKKKSAKWEKKNDWTLWISDGSNRYYHPDSPMGKKLQKIRAKEKKKKDKHKGLFDER
jgi:DNA-directed RNA polymerase subunit RPC12/RpoP